MLEVVTPNNATPFKADKAESSYRNYDDESSALHDRVKRTYYTMHTKQCVEYVKNKHKEWLGFNHTQKTIMEVVKMLEGLVDESDPDVDFANSYHAYQTAERIREVYPDNDWFQLTGFIHDLGKLMSLYDEPQYSTVGDTFPVGCQFSPKIVYGLDSFAENPDLNHPVYSTKFGIYEKGCGLDNLTMSWGHDEYLYRVLKNAPQCRLPAEALYAIRFHSFYPWHNAGEYTYFENDNDQKMKEWVYRLNKFDLYSKSTTLPDVEALKPYYQSLIDKYLPGKLDW